MCRSSRILAFIFTTVVIAAPATGASAQARMGIGPAGAPAFTGAPRAAIRPGLLPNVNRGVVPNVHSGIAPNVRPNVFPGVNRGIYPGLNRGGYAVGGFRARPGRYGRFGAGSALGLAGLGLSLLDDGAYAPLGDEVDEGFGPQPPAVIPAYVPPACIRPLVIKVGNGLRRRAKTRVVYGSQPGCGRAYER